MSALRSVTAGLIVYGFGDQFWSSVALPLDLKPLGAAGCFLNIDPLSYLPAPSDATGRAFVGTQHCWTAHAARAVVLQPVPLLGRARGADPPRLSSAGAGRIGL